MIIDPSTLLRILQRYPPLSNVLSYICVSCILQIPLAGGMREEKYPNVRSVVQEIDSRYRQRSQRLRQLRKVCNRPLEGLPPSFRELREKRKAEVRT